MKQAIHNTLEYSPTMLNCMPSKENTNIYNNANHSTKRANPESEFKNRGLKEIQNLGSTRSIY